uniref:Uncharacterized protein n=1 Tax=viral metagenome TaxID=1070528 RepID=A0A6C0IDI6_9ZZZZ
MYSIVSTRFNKETWIENQERRRIKNVQCCYGSPQAMSPKIEANGNVFVVDMNNSINKIEGIGFIKNKPQVDKFYKIHSDINYNRFAYFGNYYINRELLIEYNEAFVLALDNICFKGKTHLKRGIGFTTIPEKLMDLKKLDGIYIRKEIKDIFIKHYECELLQEKEEKQVIQVEVVVQCKKV